MNAPVSNIRTMRNLEDSEDLLQRARDIAADQYIRLEMKKPTNGENFRSWSEHVERYAGFLRSGAYDDERCVQSALAALRSVAS